MPPTGYGRVVHDYGGDEAMMALEREVLPDHLMDRVRSGKWKAENIRLLERALAPGMHVCEIGSGLGYCTQVISRLVEPDGVTVGFEPNPLMYEIAARRNENAVATVIVNAAVALHHGACRIDGPPDEPWRCVVQPDPDGPIPMRHLTDDIVTETSGFNAVVFDCEGMEHAMLDTAGGTLRERGVKHIICEAHGADAEVEELAAVMHAHKWRLVARTRRDPWDNVSMWWTPKGGKR